ncbi:MAG: four helix bundle protein [Pseudomonadota bacterium]
MARFEDIEAWQDARKLVEHIYRISSMELLSKDYGFKDQLQRAGVSIMSNIAEGFEREGNKEFIQFLFIAKASAGEVRSLLYVASDLQYLDSETFNMLENIAVVISKKISGLIKYLKTSPFKGSKNLKLLKP